MSVLQGPIKPVRAVAYAPDGALLAAGSDDGAVRLWDPESRQPTQLGSFGAALRSIAWTPDARALVWSQGSVATDGAVYRVGVGGAAFLLYSSINRGPVGGVCVSPDGRTAYAAAPGGIRRWAVDGWKPLPEWETASPGCLAVSPDGRVLASAHPLSPPVKEPRRVVLWDADTGRPRRELADCREPCAGLAFAPDGARLAAIGHQTLWLWKLPAGKPVCSHRSKTFYTGVAFSPDGRLIATTGSDGRIRLWDGATGEPLKSFTWTLDQPLCVAFAPDSTRVAVGDSRGCVTVWDVDGASFGAVGPVPSPRRGGTA